MICSHLKFNSIIIVGLIELDICRWPIEFGWVFALLSISIQFTPNQVVLNSNRFQCPFALKAVQHCWSVSFSHNLEPHKIFSSISSMNSVWYLTFEKCHENDIVFYLNMKNDILTAKREPDDWHATSSQTWFTSNQTDGLLATIQFHSCHCKSLLALFALIKQRRTVVDVNNFDLSIFTSIEKGWRSHWMSLTFALVANRMRYFKVTPFQLRFECCKRDPRR